MRVFLFVILLFLPLCAEEAGPQNRQETLTLFRFDNRLPDTAFNEFHRYLAPKFERELVTGFKITVLDCLFETMQTDSLVRGSLRIAVHGRFEKGPDSVDALRFKIRDVKTNVEEEKIIALNYMEKEDIAQIILLKCRNFLSRSILGAVAVTSSPLNMAILLDNAPQGRTPREFFLKAGPHSLEIIGDHFEPYRDEFTVVPGKSLSLGAEMEFKGRPTRYWLLGACAATWELMVVWVLERNTYRDWHDKAGRDPLGNYDSEYNRYHNVRTVRFTVLSFAGIGWIGAGFCYFTNKSLKNKLVTNNK